MIDRGWRSPRRRPWSSLMVGVTLAVLAATSCVPPARTVQADATSMQVNVVDGARRVVVGRIPSSPDVMPSPSAEPATRPPPDAPSEGTTLRQTGPATTRAAEPVRLRIPSIGVDSPLIDLGLQSDGTLEVPPAGFPAGWYTGSPTPGEIGPSIIAGHVDWAGQPGVFHDLRDLEPGDEIMVSRQDGGSAAFRVTRVERFPKDAFPTQAVYGDLDHAGLRLITCGGAFDRDARSYEDNIVVFAARTAS